MTLSLLPLCSMETVLGLLRRCTTRQKVSQLSCGSARGYIHVHGITEEILSVFEEPSAPLLRQVLSHNVKPVFQSNPHPSLNLTTGRRLTRPAGGPMASQDFYEGQSWKAHPGVSNVLSWCVRHTSVRVMFLCYSPLLIERWQGSIYDDLWHLIIPPVMALLDDYQAVQKLKGVKIVSEMLKNVPKELLKRTGVETLLVTVGHSHSRPSTMALILISHRTSPSIHASHTYKAPKHLTCYGPLS